MTTPRGLTYDRDIAEIYARHRGVRPELLKTLVEEHSLYTKSAAAKKILDDWENTLPKFLKVYPRDYRRVLEERKAKAEKGHLVEVA